MPNSKAVICDIKGLNKKHVLHHHNKKLAIAYGLISTRLEHLSALPRTFGCALIAFCHRVDF
eukprot:c22332_g1_i1 orf=172-357(+)